MQTFELEKQTLPQISQPMSARVIQLDQPMTPEDMESEWQQFLMSIKDHMHDHVYVPLETYYTDKISHLTNNNSSQRESIFQCIRKTEWDIRKWLEPQKRLLMYKNGRNASDGYIEYIKASFSESMDQLVKVFRDEWLVKIADCYKQATIQMKHLISSAPRTIKTPLDMSEKQSQLMKVMNIRGDPMKMTHEQNQIYEETVSGLMEEMKTVPFSAIEPRLQPVSSLNPFLDEIWSQMQTVYSSENTTGKLNQYLDSLYTNIKADKWNEHLFDFIVALDKNRRKSYWQSVLDLSSSNNSPAESVQLKKQFIYNGAFTKFLTNLYAPHQATLETYIKTMVPALTKQWVQTDIDAIANNARVAESQFKLLHKVYHERFPSPSETSLSLTLSLSWLSRAIDILHNYNSKENLDQLQNEWLLIKN